MCQRMMRDQGWGASGAQSGQRRHTGGASFRTSAAARDVLGVATIAGSVAGARAPEVSGVRHAPIAHSTLARSASSSALHHGRSRANASTAAEEGCNARGRTPHRHHRYSNMAPMMVFSVQQGTHAGVRCSFGGPPTVCSPLGGGVWLSRRGVSCARPCERRSRRVALLTSSREAAAEAACTAIVLHSSRAVGSRDATANGLEVEGRTRVVEANARVEVAAGRTGACWSPSRHTTKHLGSTFGELSLDTQAHPAHPRVGGRAVASDVG
jgi:hypothetical protein